MGNFGIGLHLYLDGMENPDIDWALQYVRDYRPRWMNVTAFARHDQAQGLIEQIRQASPTTRTIWRGGPNEVFPDEDLWNKVNPARWFQLRVEPYIDWLRATQTAVLTMNESGWSHQLALNEADAAERCEMVGVTAAVMRFSTGSPGEPDEYVAMADALRRIARTRAIITPNEYTAKDRPNRGGHVARYQNFWRIQGDQRSEIVIGEYAPVRFQDGRPQAHDGWQRDNISLSEYVKIMVEDNPWYLNSGVSRMMYCVGRWQNDSFGLNKHFPSYLRGQDFTLRTLTKPEPPPPPAGFVATDRFQPAIAVVPAGTTVNVRSMPSTLSRSGIIGRVSNGTVCQVMLPPSEPMNWYVVRLPDFRIGYIRSDVVSWRVG